MDSAAGPFSELAWGSSRGRFSLIRTSKAFHMCNKLGTAWLALAVLPPEAVVWALVVRGRRGPCRLPGWLQAGEARRSRHLGVFTQEPWTLQQDKAEHPRIPQTLGFMWWNHTFLPINWRRIWPLTSVRVRIRPKVHFPKFLLQLLKLKSHE